MTHWHGMMMDSWFVNAWWTNMKFEWYDVHQKQCFIYTLNLEVAFKEKINLLWTKVWKRPGVPIIVERYV